MDDGRAWLTRLTTLRLATPYSIVEVLRLLGINWSPEPASTREEIAGLSLESGLYIWVKADVDESPMNAGGLYAGIGDGANGLRGRLLREYDAATGTAYHGHGICVQRTEAIVVAGEVAWIAEPERDLGWINRQAEGLKAWDWKPDRWDDEWDVVIRKRLTDRVDAIVPTAEAVAVRAAVYLGDVGFPVNSKMAGAWGFNYGSDDKGWEDGAAWAAVTHLLGAAESLPGEEEKGATSPTSPVQPA